MINLNAIIQAAHDGEGINNLAQQFDISPQEAQEAVQALLPALSMGLQSQMQGPGFAQVLGHLATQQNQAAFEDANAAQTDDTIASGTDAINHLFGHQDVTQQVAENAAEHSSASSDLLQSMLPVIAAMVMGGLFKSIAAKGGLGGMFGGGAAQTAPEPETGGVGDILGQMTGQRAPAPAPQQSGGGIGDILGQLTGGQQPQTQAAPQHGGGLGDLLGGLLGGAQGSGAQSGGLGDILGQLTGGQPRGNASQQGGGGLEDLLGGLLGGQKGGATQGGGLGDILGQLAGAGQRGGAQQQGGGGLGDLLGGLLGGGAHAQAGAPGAGNSPQIQAGLEQLSNLFGHGTKVSPQQQSGLDGILGQLFGGRR